MNLSEPPIVTERDDRLELAGCEPGAVYPVTGEVLTAFVAEVNRLKTELAEADADRLVKQREIERLRAALSHDREVCGREEGLCWKCRVLEEGSDGGGAL